MRRIVLTVVVALAWAVPASAEDRGAGLMRKGLELFFEGLQDEVSPTLREFSEFDGQVGPAMRGFLEEMGLAFGEVLAGIEDWSSWHPPEILPNGDIILRRKTVPKALVPDEGKQDQLEL